MLGRKFCLSSEGSVHFVFLYRGTRRCRARTVRDGLQSGSQTRKCRGRWTMSCSSQTTNCTTNHLLMTKKKKTNLKTTEKKLEEIFCINRPISPKLLNIPSPNPVDLEKKFDNTLMEQFQDFSLTHPRVFPLVLVSVTNFASFIKFLSFIKFYQVCRTVRKIN